MRKRGDFRLLKRSDLPPEPPPPPLDDDGPLDPDAMIAAIERAEREGVESERVLRQADMDDARREAGTLFSVNEVAEYLGISTAEVRRQIGKAQRTTDHPFKVGVNLWQIQERRGPVWLFSADAIEAYRANRKPRGRPWPKKEG